RLEFSLDTGAQTSGDYNRVGGHYGTQCKFPGDFNARVDFTLPTWPDSNGVGVTLWAFLANRGDGIRRQSNTQWGELYSSWVGADSAGVQLSDASGSLRLARRGGVLRSYFWHRGAWRKLLSHPDPGLVTIAIGADAGPDFADAPVVATFDNFVVNAADAVCPPGSDPRGS